MNKKSKYFNFLCSMINADREQDYEALLEELFMIIFYPLIPNDDNRAHDGKQLRNIYMNQAGQPALFFSLLDDECSVLEMLIGLSLRLEFETAQSKWEKTSSEWFWILIDNLGLTALNSLTDIRDRVMVFLKREYKSNGDGGLFPLKYPKNDQRTVEIWYQMSAYILENYPI